MSVQERRDLFTIELLITGTTPAGKGTQIAFGRCDQGIQYSLIAKSSNIARRMEPGERWEIVGEKDRQTKYQNQILVDSGQPAPVTGAALAEYIQRHPRLRCGETQGSRVGKGTWEKAIEKAGGGDALAALLDARDKDGITALRVGRLTNNINTIFDRWHDLCAELEAVKMLVEYQVPKRLSYRLLKHYGERVCELFGENCYKILAFEKNTPELIRNCENIANKLAYPQGDERRLVGAVDYVMNYRLDDGGHTATPPQTLLKALSKHFKGEALAQTAIDTALKTGAITVSPGNLYQSRPTAFAEMHLEHCFEVLLKNTRDDALTGKSATVQQIFESANVPLTDEQKHAISQPFQSHLTVIKGCAGTGKTTVISAIINLAEHLEIPVYQMALSGKAADVMRSYSEKAVARTIHWHVLQIENAHDKGEEPKFKFAENGLIILDESSMIDLSLMNRLVRVLPENRNYRILMIGDPNQIPPVGPGLVFHRLCQSQHVPTGQLTKVHRSAAETGIPQAGELISQGIPPELPTFNPNQPKPDHGVFFLPATIDNSDRHCLSAVLFKVAEHIGLDKTQVISTHRAKSSKGGAYIPASVHWINQYFQQQTTSQNKSLTAWGLNEGDPVLIRKNVMDLGGRGISLFNGNVGQLERVDKPSVFQFGDDTYELELEDLSQLGIQLGYALTVHSFQGSAAECVVVAISESKLLDRSLIYTALTRAKKICVFVGDKDAFDAAITAPPKWERVCTAFSVDRYFEKNVADLQTPHHLFLFNQKCQ